MQIKITYRLCNGLKPDPKNPNAIYVRFRVGRAIDFKASINHKVFLKHWDSKNGNLKRTPATIKDYHTITARIDGVRTHFEKLALQIEINKRVPDLKEIRAYYNTYFNYPTNATEKTSFLEYFQKFIEDAKTKPNATTKKVASHGTVQGYERTKQILTDFNNEVYKITFEKITYEFYTDFIKWLENKGYARNYIGKVIKNLKVFLNDATEKEINTNNAYKSKRFTTPKEDTDNIYLTIDELLNLWHLDLSNEPRKEVTRNLFLIGAFTGLRVSDFSQIAPQNIKEINGKELIQIKAQKTGKAVAIPLHPIIKTIINEHPDTLKIKISHPEQNRFIKEIANRAKITNPETTAITKGGQLITTTRPKFELITTHTARRSFCTNAYLSNMPAIDIMAISGHKTEKVFLSYIKATPEQRALKISEHEFFNQSFLKAI